MEEPEGGYRKKYWIERKKKDVQFKAQRQVRMQCWALIAQTQSTACRPHGPSCAQGPTGLVVGGWMLLSLCVDTLWLERTEVFSPLDLLLQTRARLSDMFTWWVKSANEEDDVPNLIVVAIGFAFGSGAGFTSASGIARRRATYICFYC